MAEKKVVQAARRKKRKGMAPTTQAGEFVHEEIEHVREGKHGARSTKQTIAIGLSKARRAGIKVPVPKKGTASARTRKQAARNLRKGQGKAKPSARRGRAVLGALKREGRAAASHTALSRQATTAARKRGPTARHRAAEKAVRTKGPTVLRKAGQKAARTRKRHHH